MTQISTLCQWMAKNVSKWTCFAVFGEISKQNLFRQDVWLNNMFEKTISIKAHNAGEEFKGEPCNT